MRFHQVIAVNPPSPPGWVANRDSMGGYGQLYPIGATPSPPLDLPYLAGYLAAKGVPVEVLEAQGLDLDLESLVEQFDRRPRGSMLSGLGPVRVPCHQRVCTVGFGSGVWFGAAIRTKPSVKRKPPRLHHSRRAGRDSTRTRIRAAGRLDFGPLRSTRGPLVHEPAASLGEGS